MVRPKHYCMHTHTITSLQIIVGLEAVKMISNRLKQIGTQKRCKIDNDTWAPEQSTKYISLLLFNYQGNCTQEQVKAMAEVTCTGDIDKVVSITSDRSAAKYDGRDSYEKLRKIFATSKVHVTTKFEEILMPLDKITSTFILFEGAPGIGKSVLLQEIFHSWADKKLLQKFDLALLVCLRNPDLHKIKSVSDLLHLFFKGDENATEIISACGKYLSRNGGENLVLLLDGYDEYPDSLQQSSLIADILKREVLPLCGLIVSSRPHASLCLCRCATIKADILGFNEKERENYIKQELSGQQEKIEELTQYFQQRPSIDSICFIPMNIAILLHLYKNDFLPENVTELYKHFICLTISRHLSKFGESFPDDNVDLNNLPEPFNRIINQLSKLSLEALNSNKLTFSLDEITAACPDIEAIPGAINGFGLLQAVRYFGIYTKKTTFNFMHLTIQEYLAAHYVSHLPPNEELKVINANFWSNIHSNMFFLYISLTKGQRSSLKKFLSGGNEAIAIADKFLKDQLKCLRLYHCFKEAEDNRMCNTIEQAEVFKNKVIDLMAITLTDSDVWCISEFLTSALNKKWEWLNLDRCKIQDKGLKILHHGLCCTTVNKLWLMSNHLTAQSSSLVGELAVKCKVKKLVIANNENIGEDQELYSMLSNHSNVLKTLDMWNTDLSCTAATDLFTSLKSNYKLQRLYIDWNDAVNDDACDAITTVLQENSHLVRLSMHGCTLSSEAIVKIVQCLEVNDTLQAIGFPECTQATKEKVKSLQEAINNQRISKECLVNLEVKFGTV